MEVVDRMLKNLDSIIEHDNRTIGNQQMQTAVLRWAVEHKDVLWSHLTESLVECMEQQLAQMKRDRPSAADSFRAIRQVNAEREPQESRTEEDKREDDMDRQRAYPERRP